MLQALFIFIMLRLARTEDIDFLYIMYMHPSINPYLLYEQMNLETFVEVISDLIHKNEIYILEADNIPVAMCKLVPNTHRDSHKIYIGGLAVHPNYKGRGYGKLLIKNIINFAKQKGIKRLELTVAVSNNAAIALYTTMGFEQEGVLKYFTHLISKNEYVDEVMMAYYF